MQTAFHPILNFARFQCLLPLKTIQPNGKCKKSSITARIFSAVLVASTSYMAYLIACDLLVFTELHIFFTDTLFTCIYFSNVQTIISISFTSHSIIRNGCKWLSLVLGAFACCKLQPKGQSVILKKHLTGQRIKVFYGACSSVGLCYLLVGPGNKLTWQFQVIKCFYQLQIYTIEQIVTTLNDYFHLCFKEVRQQIIYQKSDFYHSRFKVRTFLILYSYIVAILIPMYSIEVV